MSKATDSAVSEVKTEAVKPRIELWFSFDSISHHITLEKPGSGAVKEYMDVWFKNYRLELDLNDPEQAMVSAALKRHPRHGNSFARLVNKKADGEKQRQWEAKIDFLLHPKHHERRGLEKVSAMFSPGELEEAGIDVRDLDTHRDKLNRLAVNTRNLKDVNED